MQLGFFTMPIHPIGKDWRLSLREDRDAFALATSSVTSRAMPVSTSPIRARTSRRAGRSADYICDRLWGSPARVADELLRFRDGRRFRHALYAGKDRLDYDLGRR